MSLGNSSDASRDEMTVKEIISVYSNHPSIQKIKNVCVSENKFDLPNASTSDINKIIKACNENKAERPETFLQNVLKCQPMLLIVYS